MLISIEGEGKSQLQASQENMGDATVSSHCSLSGEKKLDQNQAV